MVGWGAQEGPKPPCAKKTPMLLLVELRTCNRCWTCSFLGDGLVGLDFGKDVWKKFQQKIFSKWLSFNGDLPWKKKKLDPGNHPEGCTPRKHGICFIFSLFPWKKVKKSPYTNPKLVGWESVPLKVERVKLPWKFRWWTRFMVPSKKTSGVFSGENGGLVNWLVVSTNLKKTSQIGNLPQVGLKIKNLWNHRLVKILRCEFLMMPCKSGLQFKFATIIIWSQFSRTA